MIEWNPERIEMLHAFSVRCGLAIKVVQEDGHVIAAPKNQPTWINASSIEELIRNCEQITAPSIMESTHDGAPTWVILAPIQRSEAQSPHYLLAEYIADGEDRLSMRQQADLVHRQLPVLQRLTRLLAQLSAIDARDQASRKEVDKLQRLARLASTPASIEIDELLRLCSELLHSFPLVGIAQQVDLDHYAITHVTAGFEKLVHERFIIGEGGLGRVAATAKGHWWPDVVEQMVGCFFITRELRIEQLFCYPIWNDNEYGAVLFGCSFEKRQPQPYDEVPIIATIIAGYIARLLRANSLNAKTRIAETRLSAMLDMSNLVMLQETDKRKLFHVIVDLSLHYNGSMFSCVMYQDPIQPGNAKFIARGLGVSALRAYGEELTKLYFSKHQGEDETVLSEPIIRRSPAVGRVLEAFIRPFQQTYGVLSIKLSEHEDEAEATTYFNGFTIIAALALEKTTQVESRADRTVHALQKALLQWNPTLHEQTRQLAREAEIFACKHNWRETDALILKHAAMLYPYDLDILLSEQLSEPILNALTEFRMLQQVQRPDCGIIGQTLYLLHEFLTNDMPIETIHSLTSFDSQLRQAIYSFLKFRRHIETDIALPPGPEGTDSLEASHKQDLIPLLTTRELEVFELIGQGFNNKQIARKLIISEHTVKNHVSNMYQKLQVTDRSHATAVYFEWKYLSGK